MLSRHLTFSLLALLLLGTALGLMVDPVEAAASKKIAGTVVFVYRLDTHQAVHLQDVYPTCLRAIQTYKQKNGYTRPLKFP